MQVPRQEDLVLQMIGGSVGHFRKHRWRGFQRVAGFKVDDARAILPGQDRRGDDVQKPKDQCTHERIVQPLGNLMAQCLNVENSVADECSGFRVGCIDPGLRRGGRRPLRGVVTENSAGIDRSVEGLIDVIGEKNR